jgi:hypothetical protein
MASRGQTIAEAVKSGELVAFIYDLHASVNRKLSLQRYTKLRVLLSQSIDLPITADEAILDLLESSISIESLRRRSVVYIDCPWNVGALWILLLLLAPRARTTGSIVDYLSLLECMGHFLSALSESVDASEASMRMKRAHKQLTAWSHRQQLNQYSASNIVKDVMRNEYLRLDDDSQSASLVKSWKRRLDKILDTALSVPK